MTTHPSSGRTPQHVLPSKVTSETAGVADTPSLVGFCVHTGKSVVLSSLQDAWLTGWKTFSVVFFGFFRGKIPVSANFSLVLGTTNASFPFHPQDPRDQLSSVWGGQKVAIPPSLFTADVRNTLNVHH